MVQLGLTSAAQAALLATLAKSHRIRLTVDVLNRNEKPNGSLTVPESKVLDGTVEVDANADITRSLRMTLLDPRGVLSFDSSSPAQGALFADRMLAVKRGTYVPGHGWVDIPVFWGILTDFARNGDQVTIEAQGKEALGLAPHFAAQGYTLAKGRTVDDAIRAVMGRVGETRYSLPELNAKLSRARAVEPEDEPWDVVKFGWEAEQVRRTGKGKKRRVRRVTVEYNGLISLADGKTIFYDGLGRLTVRARSLNSVFTFKEGVHLLGEPAVSHDALVARNRVVVTGAVVTVGKKPHRRQVQRVGTATLQASHPMSPSALARNGEPRYMTEFVEVGNLTTHDGCVARAKAILKERSQAGMDISFQSLPVPLLEERDVVRLVTPGYTFDFRLERFNIPLTAEQPMTVGYGRE